MNGRLIGSWALGILDRDRSLACFKRNSIAGSCEIRLVFGRSAYRRYADGSRTSRISDWSRTIGSLTEISTSEFVSAELAVSCEMCGIKSIK